MEIFLLTRPSRDVTYSRQCCELDAYISTHTSLAGRDLRGTCGNMCSAISTHTSLAGRDWTCFRDIMVVVDFYSHVPRGT